MRILLRTLAAVTLPALFLTFPGIASDRPSWYRFTLADRMDTDSPAALAQVTLDAPAGKHGFLKTQGERFVFEDGTPARFWGTNLGSYSTFPSHEEADRMAERFAFLGFNIIRLHHMDMYDEPGGIFKKGTNHLSPAQMDRLDYLVHRLKERGIYVNINLLVMRRFDAAEGVTDADKIEPAGKPVSLFDPRLIELQKEYAQALLTHKNAYTGLRYCDDPAVAFVEITNENSIFQQWQWDNLNGYLMGLKKGSIPPAYVAQLDTLWNKWLEKKYVSLDAVKKVWAHIPFIDGVSNRFDFKRPLYKTYELLTAAQREDIETFYTEIEKDYFTEMTRYLKETVGVRVPVTGMGGLFHHRDRAAMESSDFIDVHTYWDHPEFPRGWSTTDFKMHLKPLLRGEAEGFINAIDNSRAPGRPLTVSEWNQCYPNPFAYELPLLMASQGRILGWEALYQFAWTPGAPFELHRGNLDTFFHISQNAQQQLLCLAGSALFHSPGEVTHTLKDGVLSFRSSHAQGVVGAIQDRSFDLGGLTIRSAQDAAVVLFSTDGRPLQDSDRIILLTVGPIKNRDSRWAADRFYWGGPWSLLQNIPVSVTLKTPKQYRFFELREDGTRGKEFPGTYKEGALTISTSKTSSPWFELSTS